LASNWEVEFPQEMKVANWVDGKAGMWAWTTAVQTVVLMAALWADSKGDLTAC
jgi:hypothetical protein